MNHVPQFVAVEKGLYVKHGVDAVSSMNLVDGKGSRGWSAAAPVRDRKER